MAYPNAGLPNDLGDYDECAETTAAQVRQWCEQGIVNLVSRSVEGLKPNNVTIIDNDTEMIRVAGQFGMKVYYGDGTRLDLLEAMARTDRPLGVGELAAATGLAQQELLGRQIGAPGGLAGWFNEYDPATDRWTKRPDIPMPVHHQAMVGVNGNTMVATPHIDSLAREGVTCERFFVCPVCSPTRAEFLTGRYHQRGGVTGVSTGQAGSSMARSSGRPGPAMTSSIESCPRCASSSQVSTTVSGFSSKTYLPCDSLIAWLLASLPPEVKTTSAASQPSSVATCGHSARNRAPNSASAAATAVSCCGVTPRLSSSESR